MNLTFEIGHLFAFLMMTLMVFYFFYEMLLLHISKTHERIISETNIQSQLNIHHALDDITEFIEQFELTQKMLENMTTMVDQINGISMWIKDRDDRYIYANRSVRKILFNDIPIEEMIGKLDSDIRGQSVPDGIYKRLESALSGLSPEDLPKLSMDLFEGGLICNLTDVITRSFKKPCRFHEEVDHRSLDVWKTPVLDKNGAVIATVGAMVDVTPYHGERRDQLQYMVSMGKAYRIDSTPNYYMCRYEFGGFEKECELVVN